MGRFLPRPQGAGNPHLNYLKAADATRAAANAMMSGSLMAGSFHEAGG